MIVNVAGMIIGAMILAAGIYYLFKEREDKEARKIYSVASGAGAAIIIVLVVKILIWG